MPDFTFNVFRIANVGGSNGLETAGSVTVRDDNGFRDNSFDDIEQSGPGEYNGDQEIVASALAELDVGDTIRTRGIFRFTNNDTNETFDVIEIFSQTAGNPVEQLFIFTSTVPDWVFDNTSRSFALINADGTIPYSSIVCFAAGTFIRDADGNEVLVESIKAGDRILTQDDTAHTVRWVGSKKVSCYDLMVNPKLKPIRIEAGALGCDLPVRDLVVSRQHRILVRSKIAERIFGCNEVLIPANKLIALKGINVAEDIREVEYYHILFDRHRVIFSNGAMTESLFTGPEAMKSVSPEAREEIAALVPEALTIVSERTPALPIPKKGKDIKHLIDRHQKNDKPLLIKA